MPRPVAGSGVRFDATVCPHPPAHAVRSSEACTSPGAGVGTFVVCGRPESIVSGTGFIVPATFGEWQSWHPVMPTRYLPRSTWLSDADCARSDGATASERAKTDATQIVAFIELLIELLRLNWPPCRSIARPTGCCSWRDSPRGTRTRTCRTTTRDEAGTMPSTAW